MFRRVLLQARQSLVLPITRQRIFFGLRFRLCLHLWQCLRVKPPREVLSSAKTFARNWRSSRSLASQRNIDSSRAFGVCSLGVALCCSETYVNPITGRESVVLGNKHVYQMDMANVAAPTVLTDNEDPKLVTARQTLQKLLTASGANLVPPIKLTGTEKGWLCAVSRSRIPLLTWFLGPEARIGISSSIYDDSATAALAPGFLAHELAHILARHTDESFHSVSRLFAWAILLPRTTTLYALGAFFKAHPWSAKRRRFEFEADHMGAILSAKAGIEPWLFHNLLILIADGKLQVKVDEAWHPACRDRVNALDEAVPQAVNIWVEAVRAERGQEGLLSALQEALGG